MNFKITVNLFLALFLGLSLGKIYAQKLSTGPQVATFYSDIDDTEQPYGLYIPKNFQEGKKYPLVIMLHGAGSNHRLSLKRVFDKSNSEGETDVEASRYFPEWNDVEFIVASPFARGTMGYQGVSEKDVMDVLTDVKKRFLIDEDRTYLTGLSMGGGGTLWIGLTRPDIWAAIAPVCPSPPKGARELVGNALNYPAHFFHGDQDPVVNVKVSREIVQEMKDLGCKVEYIEYPGVQHNSWEAAYKDGYIFDWFRKFTRNPYPDHVRYSTSQYKYNRAYWVQLDQLVPGKISKIDAKFSEANQITISTENLEGFTLFLKGHPKFRKGETIQLIIDGSKLKVSSQDSLSVLKVGKKWVEESVKKPIPSKKGKGAEGPIREAFSSRHIYIYGTAGNPSEAELKIRIRQAEEAANWSVYRGGFLGRIMVFPRVVADKEVRKSDLETSNLILFGTKESNSLIQKYNKELPIHLDSAVKDMGLLYIYPMNGRYVAVSSGLSWWTGADPPGYTSTLILSRMPEFKDYILFKDSVKNIISEGYFDNNWKLKAEDAKKLSMKGVVVKQ